jgi:hypothetical protein
MDNFIEEVDEDLKRERYAELWRKYGTFIVGAVLLVVIAVAGSMGWRQYQLNTRIESGLEYVDAVDLAAAGKTADAIAAFQALAKGGAPGYRDLARFQEAAALVRQGNEAAAAQIYDAIAKDEGADAVFRNIALILYALNVADRAEPTGLADRLKPLTGEASPWRFSALEITALLHRRRGDVTAARSVYKKLADDERAPPRLRARAAEFLAVIGK